MSDEERARVIKIIRKCRDMGYNDVSRRSGWPTDRTKWKPIDINGACEQEALILAFLEGQKDGLSRLRTEQEGKINATKLKDVHGRPLSIGQRVRLTGPGYEDWRPCTVERDDFGTPGFIPEGYPLFVTFDRYFMQEKNDRNAFKIIDPPAP